jgi:hypothetical protein
LRAGERRRIVGCHDDRFALRLLADGICSRRAGIAIVPSATGARSTDRLLIPTSDADVKQIGARDSPSDAACSAADVGHRLCQDKYALAMVLRAAVCPRPVTHAVRRLADIPDSSAVWRPRDRS